LEIETLGKAEWLPFDDDDDFISGDEGYEADIEFQSWINIDSSDKCVYFLKLLDYIFVYVLYILSWLKI